MTTMGMTTPGMSTRPPAPLTTPLHGPGHNGGPTNEAGYGWRRHAWNSARKALLPTLPIEVVRLRVRRAAELGLDYRTYASVRAASGHDVVAFLFSSNALRVLARDQGRLPADRAVKLAAIKACGRIGLAVAPLSPARLAEAAPLLDAAHPAPPAFGAFAELRGHLGRAIAGHPSDRVILIGDTAAEREWLAAGRLAFYLSAERYFTQA